MLLGAKLSEERWKMPKETVNVTKFMPLSQEGSLNPHEANLRKGNCQKGPSSDHCPHASSNW